MLIKLTLGLKCLYIISSLFWSVANASTSSNFTLFNATGSRTVSATKLDDAQPAFQWKLSNFVSEDPNPDAPHVSRVKRIFEVETIPYQNFTDAATLITGCVFFLSTFARSYTKGIYDDGTCSSVLDSACVTYLTSTLNTNATNIAKSSNAATEASCIALQDRIRNIDMIDSASACSSHFGVPGFSFLSAPSSASLPSLDPACSTVNVNTANATSIFKNGWTLFGSEEGNYLGYDTALAIPVPVVVVTWAKGGSGKVDTKVVCVSGNQTVSTGSRNVGVTGVSATVVGTPSSTSTTTGGASTFTARSSAALFAAVCFSLVMI